MVAGVLEQQVALLGRAVAHGRRRAAGQAVEPFGGNGSVLGSPNHAPDHDRPRGLQKVVPIS